MDYVEKIKSFKSNSDLVPQPRILLTGPVGAGKSSFINSVKVAMTNINEPLVYVDEGNNTVTKTVSVSPKSNPVSASDQQSSLILVHVTILR